MRYCKSLQMPQCIYLVSKILPFLTLKNMPKLHVSQTILKLCNKYRLLITCIFQFITFMNIPQKKMSSSHLKNIPKIKFTKFHAQREKS